MPGDAHMAGAGLLTAGWTALREARWGEARDLFARTVETESSAEAYEGASWAAWWLDDERGVLEARERAFHLYLGQGEAAAAARMATWLAADELDFNGTESVARAWLARATRLLEPLDPCPDHGWLDFHVGYLAHVAGRTERALEHGAHAADLGRRFGVSDLEMLGLALEGAALVASVSVDEGMRRLDEATAVALCADAAVPIATAWTFCLMVGACTATRDLGRAWAWCDRVAAFAARYGSRYMLAFCRAEYGAVELWRGRLPEADALLQAAVADFSESRPAWVGGPLAGLAEVRRRQGRVGDAAALLDSAGPSPSAMLCRARLALDRGADEEAADLLRRLLRKLPRARGLDRAPALEVLVQALVALGALDDAGTALEELRATERRVGTQALRASVDLAEGLILAARGRHHPAQAVLEDAVDGFDAAGAPLEGARARLALSVSLHSLGRTDVARAEAARAHGCFRELGDRPAASHAAALLATWGDDRAKVLSPRERQVAGLLAAGLTNREIGERLTLSEHTVHRHVTNILRKLDAPSRAAAAARATAAGLVD